jgi:hypothetical protein
LYGEAKAVLLAWLVLPHFKGATWMYENIIGPNWARARAELQRIPAIERLLNPEDTAPPKVTCCALPEVISSFLMLLDDLRLIVHCWQDGKHEWSLSKFVYAI